MHIGDNKNLYACKMSCNFGHYALQKSSKVVIYNSKWKWAVEDTVFFVASLMLVYLGRIPDKEINVNNSEEL